MLDELYTKDVLRQAAMISRTGRLDAPDATAKRVSPVCGSRISVDLCMKDGAITNYAQDIHACALGQSAASILAATVIGKTPEEISDVAIQMRVMLLDGGTPPDAPWDTFAILASVRDHKARHGAVMLALEATLDAAEQITGRSYLSAADALTKSA